MSIAKIKDRINEFGFAKARWNSHENEEKALNQIRVFSNFISST